MEFTNRKSKAEYVYQKYKTILKGKILDVGADEMYLKEYLDESSEYFGVGLGNHEDLIKIDLEKEQIPFIEKSFNCVLCLDVLEHLENIHEVFDEICRLSKKWVIISLPNPYADFMDLLEHGKYRPNRNFKFYGLPHERESDRHKWFFSSLEAKNFIKYRSEKNGFEIRDEFSISRINPQLSRISYNPIMYYRQALKKIAKKILFRKNICLNEFYEGSIWWLLERRE